MIDFNTESLISFHEATEQAPGKPHISTLHRWRLRGIRGVQLETCLIGGRRFTTKEALDRFFQSVTILAEENHSSQKLTTTSRKKQIDAAENALEQRLGKQNSQHYRK